MGRVREMSNEDIVSRGDARNNNENEKKKEKKEIKS